MSVARTPLRGPFAATPTPDVARIARGLSRLLSEPPSRLDAAAEIDRLETTLLHREAVETLLLRELSEGAETIDRRPRIPLDG